MHHSPSIQFIGFHHDLHCVCAISLIMMTVTKLLNTGDSRSDAQSININYAKNMLIMVPLNKMRNLCWGVLTWEGLWDDRVLHHNVRDLRFNLDSFPWQLSKDLLTEQNILGCLQFNMPCLGTCVISKIKGNELQPQKIRSTKKNKVKNFKSKAIQVVRKRKVVVFFKKSKYQ